MESSAGVYSGKSGGESMKRPQKLAVMLVPTPPYEICGLACLWCLPLECVNKENKDVALKEKVDSSCGKVTGRNAGIPARSLLTCRKNCRVLVEFHALPCVATGRTRENSGRAWRCLLSSIQAASLPIPDTSSKSAPDRDAFRRSNAAPGARENRDVSRASCHTAGCPVVGHEKRIELTATGVGFVEHAHSEASSARYNLSRAM